ncbi:MAG: hypothetical protein IKG40_01950 [Bacilli bacterium]|nr:hypothetical protein [Bacilli bacterium]
MKKYSMPALLSLIIGILMAYFVINQYESYDGITVSKFASKLYFIQSGVYSDKNNMLEDMNKFSSYVYSTEDNMFYSYIGISLSKENALKIQNYFKKIGYETIIKEKIVDNSDFNEILSQYDKILSKTSDDESIKVICSQVLAKYEEYVNGKRKN